MAALYDHLIESVLNTFASVPLVAPGDTVAPQAPDAIAAVVMVAVPPATSTGRVPVIDGSVTAVLPAAPAAAFKVTLFAVPEELKFTDATLSMKGSDVSVVGQAAPGEREPLSIQ
jgi:hypothetical protein